MGVMKRYCEHCDGVNSGGFYDDICMIQELAEFDKYRFDNGGDKYGCQVPAKIWKEANASYGDFDCCFSICDKLQEKWNSTKKDSVSNIFDNPFDDSELKDGTL